MMNIDYKSSSLMMTDTSHRSTISEIYIQLYTTKGKEGNFNTYDGTNIEIIGKSDKYPNNRGMIFMGTVTGAATGGYNRKEIEELRNEVVKAYSTIKSFTTTNDLQIYFNNNPSS